jgi:hypothetical protein
MSVSTLYTPGHPPPILKQVSDAFIDGRRMCSIGLVCAGVAAVALFAVNHIVKSPANVQGFEVIQ